MDIVSIGQKVGKKIYQQGVCGYISIGNIEIICRFMFVPNRLQVIFLGNRN